MHGVPRAGDPGSPLSDGSEAPPSTLTGRLRRSWHRVRAHRRDVLLGTTGLVLLWLGYMWATWPDVEALRDRNPESTAFIDRYLERSGASSAAWRPVPASRISPHLKEAVLVGEDLEFFTHDGFSSYEIKQAIEEAIEKRQAPRGASTITQQLAKNLWLSPSRDPLRKAKEVFLTKQLEDDLSKDRILELYLNVVEFGPGLYGAEAAARHYFGKPASALTERESAMLAASLPRPRSWHPGVDSPYYARHVDLILTRMRQVTFLDRRLGLGPPGPNTISTDIEEPATSEARPPADTVAPADSTAPPVPLETP